MKNIHVSREKYENVMNLLITENENKHYVLRLLINYYINVIPNNMEKYMSFSLGNVLIFLDSFQFMSQSLEKLASNLEDKAFKYT